MQYNFRASKEEKEKIFHTNLVKYGIKYDKAAKVAKLLASENHEDSWTEEEKILVAEVCKEWLIYRKRYKKVIEAVNR